MLPTERCGARTHMRVEHVYNRVVCNRLMLTSAIVTSRWPEQSSACTRALTSIDIVRDRTELHTATPPAQWLAFFLFTVHALPIFCSVLFEANTSLPRRCTSFSASASVLVQFSRTELVSY